jgi:hypothetical protein
VGHIESDAMPTPVNEPILRCTRSGSDRDVRFDIVRGFALLWILIHHVHGPADLLLRLPRVFYFDFASVFVFISGCVCGLVYTRALQQRGLRFVTGKALRRVAALWLANNLTLLTALGGMILLGQRVGPFADGDLRAFYPFQWSQLGWWQLPPYAPPLFDVLWIYITMLAVMPALLLLMRQRWWLPLAVSLTIYMAEQCAAAWGWLSHQHWFHAGPFDLLNWQLVFVVGLTLGHRRALGWTMRPRGTAVQVSVLVFALALLIAYQLGWDWHVLTRKWDARPLRLVQLLATAWLIAAAFPRAHPFCHAPPLRLLATVGRHALPLFCVSILWSLWISALLDRLAWNPTTAYLVQWLGAGLLILLAILLDQRRLRQTPSRQHRPTIAPASPPDLPGSIPTHAIDALVR